MNGATCVFQEITVTYTCACAVAYTGIHCETFCAIDGFTGGVEQIDIQGTLVNAYVERGSHGDNWIVSVTHPDSNLGRLRMISHPYVECGCYRCRHSRARSTREASRVRRGTFTRYVMQIYIWRCVTTPDFHFIFLSLIFHFPPSCIP